MSYIFSTLESAGENNGPTIDSLERKPEIYALVNEMCKRENVIGFD